MCRADRGCNETMVLRGLTNFMDGIRKLYNEDDSAGTTSRSQAEDELQGN